MIEQRIRGRGLLIKLLAHGGLRWGETAALMGRQRGCPAVSSSCERDGQPGHSKLVWGIPKSHRSRAVVIPRLLFDEKAPTLWGSGLVFTSPSGFSSTTARNSTLTASRQRTDPTPRFHKRTDRRRRPTQIPTNQPVRITRLPPIPNHDSPLNIGETLCAPWGESAMLGPDLREVENV